MEVIEVARYFDALLRLSEFEADPSNNGLQLEAGRECRKAAFAVDACLEVFERAAAAGADLLVVHHGLSWGGEPRRWTGMTGRRFGTLFGNGLSLYAVHLPLDAHPVHGNNAALADLLKLENRRMFFPYHGLEIGVTGETPEPWELERAANLAAAGLPCRVWRAPDGPEKVRRAAVVSGGGGMDGLLAAVAAGADVLITGEMDHTMVHVLRENRTHLVQLGHYASEVHGVRNLMRLARTELGLDTVWIDCPTGL